MRSVKVVLKIPGVEWEYGAEYGNMMGSMTRSMGVWEYDAEYGSMGV